MFKLDMSKITLKWLKFTKESVYESSKRVKEKAHLKRNLIITLYYTNEPLKLTLSPNCPSPNCPSPNCPNPNSPSPNCPSPNCPSPNCPSPNCPGFIIYIVRMMK